MRIYKGSNDLNSLSLPPALDQDAGDYLPEEGLARAVDVALLLGKPLLLTGEPGTGKTQLAYSVAHELKLGKPLKFTAKHNSLARDLLYIYDSLQQFADANRSKVEEDFVPRSTAEYVRYEALGEAIRLAAAEGKRTVVLIDEIDKAPREFPNDLLTELEDLRFKVSETGAEFSAPHDLRPIVIITSNGEKPLPEAFLRRCVYYHIGFPVKNRLREIVNARLQRSSSLRFQEEELDFLLDKFLEIRDLCRRKQPATSDLLSWLQVLDRYYDEFQVQSLADKSRLRKEDREVLLLSFSVLAKHHDDLQALKATYLSENQQNNPA